MVARKWFTWIVAALLAIALVACKKATATTAASGAGPSGSLTGTDKLVLGTLKLEGTENAVTSEQAKTLLILWQALQGRALQSEAERTAVLEYIEKQMTPAQLKAIAAMRLTQDDLTAWTKDNSQGGGAGPAQFGAGQRGASGTPPTSGGAPPGGRTPPAQMSTRPAQFGGGTPQAGGATRGTTAGANAGAGQGTALQIALVRLLTLRTAEGAAPPASGRTPNRTPGPSSRPSPTPTP